MARQRIRLRGISLIEAAIGAVLLGLVVAGITPLAVGLQRAAADERAASQLAQVEQAATAYVKANFAAVEASAVGAPIEVALASLTTGNFLPSGFADANPFGQTHRITVRRPAPGLLEVAAFTQGGLPPDDRRLAAIANRLSGGGAVTTSQPAQVTGPGIALALTAWSGAPVAPGTGALVALNVFDGGALVTDYLPRAPQGTVSQKLSPGSTLDLGGAPMVNLSTLTPKAGLPLRIAGDAAINGSVVVSGTAQAGILKSSAVATIGGACSSAGIMAQDSTGLPLSCVGNVWTTVQAASSGASFAGMDCVPGGGGKGQLNADGTVCNACVANYHSYCQSGGADGTVQCDGSCSTSCVAYITQKCPTMLGSDFGIQQCNANGTAFGACTPFTFAWLPSQFGACSQSCGGGTQTRTVTCQRSDGTVVADSYCTTYVGPKPATSQVCNTQFCPCTDYTLTNQPIGGGWTTNPYTCAIYYAWNKCMTSEGNQLDCTIPSVPGSIRNGVCIPDFYFIC
jgi:type II secretory pathway pseudopilin PulG